MNERPRFSPTIDAFRDKSLEDLLDLTDQEDFLERLQDNARMISSSAKMSPDSRFLIHTEVFPEELTDDLFIPERMDITNFSGELTQIEGEWHFIATFNGNNTSYKLVVNAVESTLSVHSTSSEIEYTMYTSEGLMMMAGLTSAITTDELLTNGSLDDITNKPVEALNAVLRDIGKNFGIYQSASASGYLEDVTGKRSAHTKLQEYESIHGNRKVLDISVAESFLGKTTFMSHHHEQAHDNDGNRLLGLSTGSMSHADEKASDAILVKQILSSYGDGYHNITPETDPEQYKLLAANMLITLQICL